MHWTKKAPTENGWYWWRPQLSHTAHIVLVSNGRSYDQFTSANWSPKPKNRGGEWYGPLVEPGGDAIENCTAQSEEAR